MKKIWKRIAALLMCLALMAPAAGLAAEGDAVLARRNGMDGFTDYISHGFVLGDQLVLLGSESVYTWRHGEADLIAIPWDLTATTAMYGSVMEEEDGERAYTNYQTLAVYTDGEEIYLVVGTSTMLESDGFSTFDGAQLWTLDISGEKAAAEPVEDSEIDWEELVDYYGDESYPRSLEGCVWLDGVLYGVTYGSNDMEAYAIPTDGGYCEILEDVPTPRSVSLYKDGKVLFSSFDYNDPEQFRFVAWDPEEEELEEVCAIEIERYVTPSSIVYDEQTDRIYYTMQGLLIALDPETGAREEVNDVPSSFSGNDSAMILPGGYYAAVGYEAVIVRNTDP
ncbi:MAG: hypothetical protein Q4A66_10465, partial [Eubacteriales bacterium]|nr:hypothetical protein [Eubacteriales bacterium]